MTNLGAMIVTRALLSDPSHWIKGQLATTEDYEWITPPDHPRARKWCLTGAVWKATSGTDMFCDVLDTVESNIPYRTTVDFNDDPETTHADILAFLDNLINKLSTPEEYQ